MVAKLTDSCVEVNHMPLLDVSTNGRPTGRRWNSLGERSQEQVLTCMPSHPNHVCNGSLTDRSECNGVARFTPTLIMDDYKQQFAPRLPVNSSIRSETAWLTGGGDAAR